jgi:HJR/Mrr/RecB family endonuclease
MGKLNDLLEHGFSFFVRRISGRTALLLAVLFYGAGLALPLGFHWPTLLLVLYNLGGTLLGALVLFAWFVVRIEAARRRELVDWTTSLRLLTAEEFEWLVGEIFRREGFQVEETGRQEGPDGNVDLRLSKDGKQKVVQCKRWQSWSVGVDEIRKFAGTLVAENLPRDAGIFVTLSRFTSQAQEEAKRMGLTLVNGRELEDRRQRVRRSEPCPLCREAMVFDRSSRGWWFRCVTPGCSGKRDLGAEPGRALELLSQAPLVSTPGPRD